ncbi:MAG: hypothetical protein LRY71_00350 [Bacillaceae bacterium]|nr:hypothetical protein [Bacillaceae bacterium]
MERKYIVKITYKTSYGIRSTINWAILDEYPSRAEVASELKQFLESNDKKETDVIEVYIEETYDANVKQQKDFDDTFLGKAFAIIGEILF